MAHRKISRNKRERGAVIFESVLAICILMLVFFGLFQIYKWAMAELFCHYSVFYATKGASLGYRPNVALRAARVAAIAISGGGVKHYDEEDRAIGYMQSGDASGVHYPYWHPQNSTDPYLLISSTSLNRTSIECRTKLRNMPLVHEVLGTIFGIEKNPEPSATADAYNFSRTYLTE